MPQKSGLHCLSLEQEDAMVKKCLAKKNHGYSFEARLLPCSSEGQVGEKPKKVYCFISPRQLTIKEYHLKFIPRKLHTFRVCRATKVSAANGSHLYHIL